MKLIIYIMEQIKPNVVFILPFYDDNKMKYMYASAHIDDNNIFQQGLELIGSQTARLQETDA